MARRKAALIGGIAVGALVAAIGFFFLKNRVNQS